MVDFPRKRETKALDGTNSDHSNIDIGGQDAKTSIGLSSDTNT